MTDARSERGLLEVLERFEGERWIPVRLPDRFEPVHTRKAARHIERSLGEAEAKLPSALDLDAVWAAICARWQSAGEIQPLSVAEQRAIPYVLFYPPKRENDWLGARTRFVEKYLQWLEMGRRDRFTAATIREFLRAYPTTLATFPIWRERLERLVDDEDRPRLSQWRSRCREYRLLSADGPDTVARKWLAETCDCEAFFERLGFAGALVSGQFLCSVTERVLATINAQLQRTDREREALAGLEEREALAQFSRARPWLIAESNDFRFGELRTKIAESLLSPFVARNPSPPIRDEIRPFIVEHLGDPRISRRRWGNVAEPLVEVVLRWLVSVTLDAFFRLLDETALDQHWRYRKRFWGAYLNANVITDAWILLGPNASRQANRTLAGGASNAGKLERGGGVLSDHSVLLLRLPGATVAEWSHNGKCRLWLDGNRHAPKLYKALYYRDQLMEGADFEQTHHGTESGHWQDNIAVWIWDNLGIEMDRTQYLGRRRQR